MVLNRYEKFGQTATVNGVKFTGGISYLDLLYSGQQVWHEISPDEAGRPDLIAYKFFGDFSLWPYLCWFNGIFDPIQGLQPGDVISIPTSPINPSTDVIPNTYPGIS
jgi:hypothetical protein